MDEIIVPDGWELKNMEVSNSFASEYLRKVWIHHKLHLELTLTKYTHQMPQVYFVDLYSPLSGVVTSSRNSNIPCLFQGHFENVTEISQAFLLHMVLHPKYQKVMLPWFGINMK